MQNVRVANPRWPSEGIAPAAHPPAAGDAASIRAVTHLSRALSSAETVDDVERIVVDQGAAVLGADGGAIVSRAADGDWQLTPGAALMLPTWACGVAFHEALTSVHADPGQDGWVFVPLTAGQQRLGSLALSWAQERRFQAEELDLLEAFAAQCAQALQRIRAAETRREAVNSVQQLAEALQQALLTPPPEPDHLHLVVRYLPAGQQAQVGGDWYDAFMQPNGATMLVIGDVVGHDRLAAARMGQLRGLLRALAYAPADKDPDGVVEGPAAVLHRVEHAARGLEVDTLATVILARIERRDDESSGSRLLRWSNAGHPPPVLLFADGTSRLLDREPDLLLGVDPDAERGDHTDPLPDGSTLLLFTDGLIERPGSSLDDGFAALQTALADLAAAPLDELCDTLLARLAPTAGQDDIALLAVRSYPEDQPRPASAGPNRTPPNHPGP